MNNWNKYTVKNDGKSDENISYFFYLAWLSNIGNSLKSFILAYRALINEKAYRS